MSQQFSVEFFFFLLFFNKQIQLKEPEPIPELMRLWSSADAESRHFQKNMWFFNGHFSFTTLAVNLNENYTNIRSGVYMFQAHGAICTMCIRLDQAPV
jgi:hypothetical protein